MYERDQRHTGWCAGEIGGVIEGMRGRGWSRVIMRLFYEANQRNSADCMVCVLLDFSIFPA